MALIELTTDNVQSTLENTKLALVEFYSPSCYSCKEMMPLIEELAGEYPEVIFYKIDALQNVQTCMTYNIFGVPTVLLVSQGKLVEKKAGVCSKEALRQLVQSAQAQIA